jgi:hypothetical protein
MFGSIVGFESMSVLSIEKQEKMKRILLEMLTN